MTKMGQLFFKKKKIFRYLQSVSESEVILSKQNTSSLFFKEKIREI